MKIAIDLRALQTGNEFRGIGAYAFNVLRRLPFEESGHSFVFVRYNTSNPVEDFNLPITHYEEVIIPWIERGRTKKERVKSRLGKETQRSFKGLGSRRPDVFFQLDYLLGLPRGLGMKKFLVMYDVIPFIFRDIYRPSWLKLLFTPGLGKRRRILIVIKAWLHERPYKRGAKAARRAHRVFSISDCTTRDLTKVLGVAARKITTIPLAASTEKAPKGEAKRPDFMGGVTNPYLLFIGGVDARRKVTDLIHAFHLLNGRGHPFDFVLVGKKLEDDKTIADPTTAEALKASSYKDQIHTPGFVSQEDKAWLLEHAFAFVYPTAYEGFGMPPLEAMAQGSPVITYNNSSLPEVLGNAGVLLDEQNGLAIYRAVLAWLNNEADRQATIKKGYAQAAKFSWDTCAEQTFRALTSK